MTSGLAAGRGRFALAMAAGFASSLGFAPWNLWPLTLAALLLLVHQASAATSFRSRAAVGWWFGFGHFLLGTHWIAQAFQYQQNMPAWTGWAGVLLLSLYLAVFPGLAAGATKLVRGKAPFVLAFAGFWVIAEWLRGWLFSGFPWNPLGAALLPVPGLAQAAAVVGGLGLSAAVCLAAGAVWLMFDARLRMAGAVMLGVLALLGAAGSFIARSPSPLTTTHIDIVQANIGQDEKWADGGVALAAARYLRLSPPPGDVARLLIWPEAAVPDLLDEMPALRKRLGKRLGSGDLLLLGALKAIRGDDGYAVAARNSLFVLDSRGRILARYDKKRLVPFGEFLPMRGVLEAIGLDRLAPGALDFWPGPGPRTLELPGHPSVGPLICYEVIFGARTVDPSHRPRWLLNVSNDAWFAGAGAEMHLAQARLRAIEEGLPMARSTPTGISAVIDPRGRVLASLARGEAGVLQARLPAALPATPFSRFGDALPLLLAFLALAAALWASRR